MNHPAESRLIAWLFTTHALRVAPAEQPFWYTSGTLGPYYINTHFLFGGEQAATDLLRLIDKMSGHPLQLPPLLIAQAMERYAADTRYRQLMDLMAETLQDLPCDFISGGERRDFFFSICAAQLLGKPHVSLFKDGTIVSSAPDGSSKLLVTAELAGQTALHVADLITEASSYTRAWLPGLRSLGASLPATLAVVDRNQNGRTILADEGTRLISLVTIEARLFEQAATAGLIDQAQLAQVLGFIADPIHYMVSFLAQHPGYLEAQIALGGKNRERALRCLEQGYGPDR